MTTYNKSLTADQHWRPEQNWFSSLCRTRHFKWHYWEYFVKHGANQHNANGSFYYNILDKYLIENMPEP